ncbi:hypothetical protein GCM10010398_71950 [Streptomyces fimbriatus]
MPQRRHPNGARSARSRTARETGAVTRKLGAAAPAAAPLHGGRPRRPLVRPDGPRARPGAAAGPCVPERTPGRAPHVTAAPDAARSPVPGTLTGPGPAPRARPRGRAPLKGWCPPVRRR